ncbi:MAG: SGNH/GDSL hydrolase family protein [Pseudomonadota bacterium]
MKQALFWPAFALTLPQALWVKRTARRFEDAAGPAEGMLDGPDSLSLCGIGDSIIAGVGCRTLDQALIGHTARSLQQRTQRGVNWRAIGLTGATTKAIRWKLVPQLPKPAVDLFLISAGVNDITGLKTLSQWSSALNELLAALKAHSPGAAIAVMGIPPMQCFPLLPQPLRAVVGFRARSFDHTARRLTEALDDATYVPFEGDFRPEQFAPDGYHPSEASCAEIADHLVEALPLSKHGLRRS